jgi:DNA-3-methyladenine glycosylase II
LALAAEAVTRWWRLDHDPAELAPIAARDPVFAELLARLHGARAPLMPSPFECLVWAILGQQITVAFAYKMKRAIVERYGDALEYDGRTYWLFPEAARLAEADPAELRELQFSRQKSDYVRSLTALVAEDRVDWTEIAALPSDEAIKRLTALRGVGRWTAEYVLMRGLGHADVIPAADVGLQSAIGRAYGLGHKATEAEVRTLAERWVPHRSYAAFAWWWSLSAARGVEAPPP